MYCTRFPLHVFAQNLLKCTMEHQSTYKVNISSTLVLFGMYRYLTENRDSLSLMKFYFINYPRYVNHMYMLRKNDAVWCDSVCIVFERALIIKLCSYLIGQKMHQYYSIFIK